MKRTLVALAVTLMAACGGGGSSAPSTPLNVVIDGDSLASVDWPATTWPRDLQASTHHRLVYSAYPSALSQETLVRYAFVVPKGPGVYVLMSGANDVRRDVEVERTWSALTFLWSRARMDGHQVVAVTIGPIAGAKPGDPSEIARRELNRRIYDSPNQWDALLDLNAMFPSADDRDLLADGLHFTPAGNALVTQRMQQILTALGAAP